MPVNERVVTLIFGLLIGVVLGWLFRATRRSSADARLEQELREQLSRQEADLQSARRNALDATAGQAAAEASRRGADEDATRLRTALEQVRLELKHRQEEWTQAQSALAKALAEVESSHKLLAEQQRFHADNERELRESQGRMVSDLRLQHTQALQELRAAFKALSADTLRETAPEFARQAGELFARFQETARGDLASREQRIETLVRPLEENLKAYQQRLQQAENQQAQALGEVTKHLETLSTHSNSLSTETQRLRQIMSSNQARGRWGEETLRRVVETAGLSVHCDFVEQAASGDSRPDLIVRLPGNRSIVVDSKVPELDFLQAADEPDTIKRSAALASHANRVRSAIKSLIDRDYPRQFPEALDYVVLFLPAESLFSAALEGDPDLILWASERRVLLATPASLIGLLRSVSITWQQHEQSENAREIATAARQLYERVLKFMEHFERIRDGLLRASKAYDEAVGSYDRMIRPSGERLLKLGAAPPDNPLSLIDPLEISPRALPSSTS